MATGRAVIDLPLVQLAAYPEYDGKHDQRRERHSDAATHVPQHNEFPDCHDMEASSIRRFGLQPASLEIIQIIVTLQLARRRIRTPVTCDIWCFGIGILKWVAE